MMVETPLLQYYNSHKELTMMHPVLEWVQHYFKMRSQSDMRVKL